MPDRPLLNFNLFSMQLSEQVTDLFLLALPVASITWTITHEQIFKEPRAFFIKRSLTGKTLPERKFFYLFYMRILFQSLHCFTLSDYFQVSFAVCLRAWLPDWRFCSCLDFEHIHKHIRISKGRNEERENGCRY